MRRRLSYQASDTLLLKGIIVMLFLVLLHQKISRQSAFVVQAGMIALAGFFFWAITKIIDQWQLSHPVKLIEFDEEFLYISDKGKSNRVPLSSIAAAYTLPSLSSSSRKTIQLEYKEAENTSQKISIPVAMEDYPLFEQLAAWIFDSNPSFTWQDE